MAVPQVRADYPSLQQMAARCGAQAQAARQTLQSLQRQMDVLQGGDWIGQGASAFYQEMDSSTLPTLSRLAGALESAQQTALQISQVMQRAEADAARVLRGDGAAGSPVAFGAGAAAFTAAGPAGGGGAGGKGGGNRGAGQGGTGVAQAEVGRATPFADAIAKMVAQDRAAVDRVLSNFSPEVRALVKQSPTLSAQIAELEKKKFTIQAGKDGSGFWTNTATHTINIEQPLDDAATANRIAHEVGHATYDKPFPTHDYYSREAYVNDGVAASMRDEGAAQFNAALVRQEVRANGGPDIGIPGTQTDAYQKAYDDFGTGQISYDQAVDRMAALMGKEHVSVGAHPLYPNFYRDFYETNVDVDEEPPTPARRR